MSEGSIIEINSMMEVLRERFFISHDHEKQHNIAREYTIRSKKEKGVLTNLIFLSDEFLPNLIVEDDVGKMLSVMPTAYVKTLLNMYLKKSSGIEREKLQILISKIQKNKLYLVWVKIPQSCGLIKNEIRNIVLRHSINSKNNSDKNNLTMSVKNKSYPLYYTLYAPNDFDFKKTLYSIEKNKVLISTAICPDYVEEFETYNSKLFRINSELESSFEIIYAFKPTPQATVASRFGFTILSCFGILMIYALYTFEISNFHFLQKHVEIGIFIIAGSLLLPQLTNNDSIRSRFISLYLFPILLGVIVLTW